MNYNTFRRLFSRRSVARKHNSENAGCLVTWRNTDGRNVGLITRYKTYMRRGSRYVALYDAQARPRAIVPVDSILEVR